MGRQFRTLLIEDDEGDIDLTKEALLDTQSSICLSVVRNGTDAILYLRQQTPFQEAETPNLIILDLNLPGMSGKELIQSIRSDSHLCHIPIAVLTTSKSLKDIEDSYRLGASCYISKPSSFDEFNHIIRGLEHFWTCIAETPGVEAIQR